MCRSRSDLIGRTGIRHRLFREDVGVSSLDRVLPGGRSPKDYQALAASADTPPEVLRELVRMDYSFVAEALAGNPATPSDVLLRLVPAKVGEWNDNRRLLTLAGNPSADAAVLRACADVVTSALSEVHERGQPYSAALALAANPSVDVETCGAWARLPGSSARFRRGLQEAIQRRGGPG
jgi:hypothetical protein